MAQNTFARWCSLGWIILWIFLTGCPGPKEVKDEQKRLVQKDYDTFVPDKSTIIERYDINGDGKPEALKYYQVQDGGGQVLRKEEWDVNHDQRIDIKKIYDEKGNLGIEVMDYDFDGYFDVVNHYKAGKLHMKELSLEFKGNFNVWKYYEDGVLNRIEQDANNNGKRDTFVYYKDGTIEKVGYDTDEDGTIESWNYPSGEKNP